MHLLLSDDVSRYHEQVSFERGEIVEGTVIQFEPSGALIDIGAKASAYMPAREVTPLDCTDSSIGPTFLLTRMPSSFL